MPLLKNGSKRGGASDGQLLLSHLSWQFISRCTISALEEILLLVFINANKFLNQITADRSAIGGVFGEVQLGFETGPVL